VITFHATRRVGKTTTMSIALAHYIPHQKPAYVNTVSAR